MFGSQSRFVNVIRGLALLLVVIGIGTVGFMIIEDFSFTDAVYMTIITISTVGFGEIRTLHPDGRFFVIFLIVTGLAVMTYTLGAVAQIIIEGQFQKLIGRRRMVGQIESLRDHYIICGHGRMGEILCRELAQEKVPFVIIEGSSELAEELRSKGMLVVEGDATRDSILRQAGIERAKGLVAVVSSDVDNLYITLSAREMAREKNPALYILSRATDHRAMKKIRRAGANRVISPYQIGGMRIVQALLRPTVYDFVDIVTQSSGLDLMFEELTVGEKAEMAGETIRSSGIRQRFDVIVIAIKKQSGRMVFNPGPEQVIEIGDVLITLGDKSQLGRLRQALI
jgi:voltage-gated potassium channel